MAKQMSDQDYASIAARMQGMAEALRGQALCLEPDRAEPLLRWAEQCDARARDMGVAPAPH